MDIEELKGETTTQRQAINLVNKHGVMVSEFFEDLGVCDTYDLFDVYAWLGY